MAVELARQNAPQPLSYAPERRADMNWNVDRPTGLY